MIEMISTARRPALIALLAAGGALFACASASAIDVVAIEEHWELSIGLPDAESSAPQVTMVTSPAGTLEGDYFLFTLNHRSAPEFAPGGMQVQHWQGDDLKTTQNSTHTSTLSRNNETLSWVQRTSLVDGSLVFEIVNGAGASWGSFGGSGDLRIALPAVSSNLNDYRPAISIEQSGVNYAGNRVQSLILTKLRWIDSTGQVYELTAPIDVDADLDP